MKQNEIFAGLDNLFCELTQDWFGERLGAKCEPLSRWEVFSAPVVSFLFIAQKLSNKNSLSSALDCLKGSFVGGGLDRLLNGSRRIATGDIRSSTGGLCRARQRLPLELVEDLFEAINKGLGRMNRRNGAHQESFKRKWFLLDGSTIGLQNIKEIKAEFPTYSNQNKECCPVARVVFGHNLFDAIAQYPAIGKVTQGEQELGRQVMSKLPSRSGIVADRNFGVFSIVHHAKELGLKTLVRMTAARAGALVGKAKLENDGVYEVTWTPSKKDRSTNPHIPETASVPGRLIVTTFSQPGFRSERIFLFTTNRLSAEEAVNIYKERWLVENDIRTLKHTVNLNIIYSKTPDMIKKEILFGIVAYNMVRALIAKGAAKAQLKPRDISFTRAVGVIQATASRLSHARSPLEADLIIQAFYRDIKLVRHPKRGKPRVEPRALAADRKSRFPAIKESRQSERDRIIKKIGS